MRDDVPSYSGIHSQEGRGSRAIAVFSGRLGVEVGVGTTGYQDLCLNVVVEGGVSFFFSFMSFLSSSHRSK